MTHEPELAIERDVPQDVPQLDTAAKRALIETELRKDAGRSDREIARIVGCDHKTIGTARERLGIASPQGNSHSPQQRGGVSTAETPADIAATAVARAMVSLGGKCPPPPGVVDKPKHDPFDPEGEDMAIPHQPAIAVYENTAGAIVICQCASAYDEEDPIILVRPEHVEKLITRLRKVATEATR